MTKEEALKMCLEYIETNAHERRHVRWAIKEALAQPAQEPQVCCGEYDTCLRACTPRGRYLAQPEERNFYPRCGKRTADLTTIHTCTPPQSQWVNLTVDELIDLERKHLSHENLTRAIEAKLREKNT